MDIIESDIELIKKWKEGSEEAFDTIYERYKQTAIRTAWLLCHNLADSEDIVQETFVHGNDKVEIQECSYVQWEKDGIFYRIQGFDTDISPQEMLAMAGEMIEG